MDLRGNIPSVFTRLCDLSNAIKASAEANNTKLMWNDSWASAPNLSTGLRASVMVVLPEFNRCRDRELLEHVCSAFDLQPRGYAGEHSAPEGGKLKCPTIVCCDFCFLRHSVVALSLSHPLHYNFQWILLSFLPE